MHHYKDLDVYKISKKLSVEIHHLSLTLPKFELYEQGSQLRRSSKSVTSNIVEGYGRRKYRSDYLSYLTYSHTSLLETISHLETLNSLYPEIISKETSINMSYLVANYTHFGNMLKNIGTTSR